MKIRREGVIILLPNGTCITQAFDIDKPEDSPRAAVTAFMQQHVDNRILDIARGIAERRGLTANRDVISCN